MDTIDTLDATASRIFPTPPTPPSFPVGADEATSTAPTSDLEHARAQVGGPLRLTAPSLATRKLPRRSRGSFCGTIVAFNPPRAIHFESTGEADTAVMALVRRDLVDLREQIEAFHYVDAAGEPRSTRFDFLATLTGGRRIAMAVKPSGVAAKNGFASELALMAGQMTRVFADEVWLRTEKHASKAAVANARLILSVRRDPESGDAARVAAIAAGIEGAVTIEALMGATGLAERAYRAIVRCIDRGILEPIGDGLIDLDTMVKRIAAEQREAA